MEDRTELRGRTVEGTGVVDLETDPKATIKATARHGLDALSLSYAPRLVFTNFAGEATPVVVGTETFASDARQLDVLHQGTLALEWQLSRISKLATSNTIMAGVASVGTLLVQPRWNGEERPQTPRPFPANQRARFNLLSIASFTGVYMQVSPRLALQPAVFFLAWGAPDFEGRKKLNYLQNPGVSLDITYNVSPKDELLIQIAPQINIFSSTVDIANRRFVAFVDPLSGTAVNNVGVTTDPANFVARDLPTVYQLFSEGRYRHKVSPRLTVEGALGANVTLQDRPVDLNDPYNIKNGPTEANTRVFPTAEALINLGFRGGRNGQGRFIAYTRMASWLNNLIGEAQWRSENIAALSVTFGKDTLRAQGAALVGVPFAGEDRAFVQVLGEAGYTRKLGSFSFDAGLRLGYQVAELILGQPKNITLQPSAFLGLAWTPKPARF